MEGVTKIDSLAEEGGEQVPVASEGPRARRPMAYASVEVPVDIEFTLAAEHPRRDRRASPRNREPLAEARWLHLRRVRGAQRRSPASLGSPSSSSWPPSGPCGHGPARWCRVGLGGAAVILVGRMMLVPADENGTAHGLDGAEPALTGHDLDRGAAGLERRCGPPRHAPPRRSAAGVMPISRRNARAKLRSLMRARSASAGTERSPPRLLGDPLLEVAQRLAPAVCAASCALNCDCPPGRFTNNTSQRATSKRQSSRPRSSSTIASARSMPAVTPADV